MARISLAALSAPVAVAAILIAAPALAQSASAPAPAAETRLEAAAEAFGKRMEAFAAQAEALEKNPSLTEDEREARIKALWTAQEPALAEFTTLAARLGGELSRAALAEADVARITGEALQTAMAPAQGIIANSAWTNPDPDQMVTYELLADYGLSQAADAIEAAHAEAARAAPAAPRAD
ncbi:hypothetical protein E4M02_03555 [Brevundimonas sp. S30B]|uniref:hypothetical protein n=1 Tax=unclassified Brevundimonas TaxID=2622653 RepID=UPI001072C161|nr:MULTISPECIES: hypothetical protein [unclassified Brevundimonas]QBX37043.1 hypothetical protein E4M01_04260 [Brevundimonas sp. MF30-B]TFW04161.1 hypothetical protein E4M02_03555 [Brevundimonas sp. S30B]